MNAICKTMQTFNFELSTFVTSQQRVRAAQPGHFFSQMWNYVMHQKAEPAGHTNKDIKQKRLEHATHTFHEVNHTPQQHISNGSRQITH